LWNLLNLLQTNFMFRCTSKCFCNNNQYLSSSIVYCFNILHANNTDGILKNLRKPAGRSILPQAWLASLLKYLCIWTALFCCICIIDITSNTIYDKITNKMHNIAKHNFTMKTWNCNMCWLRIILRKNTTKFIDVFVYLHNFCAS